MMADNNNNQPRTTFELQYLIEQEKTKREEEKTKRKRLEEETKRENKKIDEETKRQNKIIEEETTQEIQSDLKSFQIYDSSFEKLPINNRQKITTNEKSKKKFHYCEDTWKIFTKFLIMNMNFYRYETLNIDPCDNQLNKYLITNRLGYGLTSKVYLLNDKENNNENQQTNNNNKRKQENNTNDIKSHVIKISKNNGYSSEFLNELMITKKLKEKDIHKFESFFQEIIYSSPTGNGFLYYFLKIFNRLKDYKE
ncbi:unnamed protein product [Rotaria sordida]|uniref:Uncharacterized protein n=1 Tax=Rotaria sordida TaxID=392033 RepID=A0A813ZMN6_9BILA|nr:unnamed protein product [Rotaria sordida]